MNTLDWLLDPTNPGPRYLALRDLVRLPADEPELLAARAAARNNDSFHILFSFPASADASPPA